MHIMNGASIPNDGFHLLGRSFGSLTGGYNIINTSLGDRENVSDP